MKKVKKVIRLLLIILIVILAIYMWKNQTLKQYNVPIAQKEVTDVNSILLEVMNNKKEFISEDNSEILLKNFKITENQTAQVDKYTFVDLDKDGTNELVILTTSDYGAYIILHYQDSKVYGYMVGIRSLEELKKDGSFIGSSGASLNEYSTMSFDKNTIKTKVEAFNDEANKVYKINDKIVSENEIKEYILNWNKKENVTWIQ